MERNKGFIHTFSLETKVSNTGISIIKESYEKDGGYFFNGDKNIGVLSAYAQEGVRIEFEQCDWREIHYEKKEKKREKKALLVVNPYKVLHPGEKYGAVLEQDDLYNVQKKLNEVVKDIYDRTGIDLFDPDFIKVKRIDCTYDVVTPSEEYSKEIIRIAQHAELPYGYKHWKPGSEKECNPEWRPENAMFMYNHNQEVESKLYNKKQDKSVVGYLPEEYNTKGLLRYELTLKRNFLKKKGYVTKEFNAYTDIFPLLVNIIENAERLLCDYLTGILDSGAIFSEKILKKYISVKCIGKGAKMKKMLSYVEYMNSPKSNTEYKVSSKVQSYFVEMGISPIFASEQCPYIPSFSDLLLGRVDNELLKFAKCFSNLYYSVASFWE